VLRDPTLSDCLDVGFRRNINLDGTLSPELQGTSKDDDLCLVVALRLCDLPTAETTSTGAVVVGNATDNRVQSNSQKH
jgi:hypothetical protein